LRLLLMATLGLSQTRDKSGELLAASGRTLLDVLERLPSALMELPTSLDALRLDQVLAIFTSTAVDVTVDENGNPWVVNTRDHIYKWTGSKWIQMPGRATQIAAGPDGTVISIWGNKVYKWFIKQKKWLVVSTILTKQSSKLKWLHERSLSVGKDG
jgi:hypothetical protein